MIFFVNNIMLFSVMYFSCIKEQNEQFFLTEKTLIFYKNTRFHSHEEIKISINWNPLIAQTSPNDVPLFYWVLKLSMGNKNLNAFLITNIIYYIKKSAFLYLL